MSTMLFFLIPLGLLAVIWPLCFVGCGYPTFTFDSYSDDVLGEQSLLAYWPLNDLVPNQTITTPGQDGKATDLSKKGHDGTYTIPPAYPSGTQMVALTLARGTPIVPGDTSSGSNPLAASADFEGGYVSIPWSTQDWPFLNEFTLEAWIQPKWKGAGSIWTVFSAATDTAGFALYVDGTMNGTNQWGLTIGDGMALTTLGPTNVPVVPASAMAAPLVYVALTCKNGVFNLWVNPQSQGDTSNPPPPPANWTSPTTNYAAADPTQLLHAFIGAGANNQALRMTDGGTGSPLGPFQGLIQSVALYQTALDPGTILSHFMSGAG